MPRINALTHEQAPEGSRPWLDGVKQAFGVVLNVFKVLAHSPAVITGYVQFYQAMETSSLTALEREAIALATAEVNGCGYCLSVHEMLGSKYGLSAEAIRSARDGELNAYTVLAKRITETRGHVLDEDLAVARAAGITDAKIVEVIAQVTLLTFTNLLNNVAQTDVELPRAKV
ncbi:carboxymuconolactone decarboxylase family protein [Pseudomonas sp. NA-150]|uniref:carboxymuconolactone decarboxylase family protein n=1 Tax=Pseudomonas sp. NA-150 TaxID=3367525 RepID=UPI0037C95F49